MNERKRTILVVENCENDVLILQLAHRRSGLQSKLGLQFVWDGEEALDYLKGEGPFADRARWPLPDCVLLDLHLPKIDGFEVLTWIRNQRQFDGIDIVVWSGSINPIYPEAALNGGANKFVVKPVRMEELQLFVKSLGDPAPAPVPAPSMPKDLATYLDRTSLERRTAV